MRKYFYLLWSLCLFGCTEDASLPTDLPLLKTLSPNNIDKTGATLSLEVVRTGTPAPSAYGFAVGYADPRVENFEKIPLSKDLQPGLHALRVDTLLMKGSTYFVRAFATYGTKTSFGNLISFKAEGSAKRSWSLEMPELTLSINHTPYGLKNDDQGYILVGNDLFAYSPENQTLPRINTLAPLGNIMGSATSGTALYAFDATSRRLHKFQNNTWSVASDLPAPLFSTVPQFAQLHNHAENLYVVTAGYTYMYHIPSGTWQQKTKVPKTGVTAMGSVAGDEHIYLLFSDKSVWAYHVLSDTWTTKPAYPGRTGTATSLKTFYHNGKMYAGLAMNTSSGDRWFDQGFWVLDLAANKWKPQDPLPPLFPLPTKSFSFSAKGKFYIGIQKAGTLYNLFMFDPTLIP